MASPSPRVSVLMPARDAETTIVGAVSSVLSQTMSDLELIVVDDGSEDRTRSLLGAIRDDRLRVIERNAPGGVAAALNAGLDACRAPFIARLDADDSALPFRLSSQLMLMDRHPELAGCGSAVVRALPDGRALPPVIARADWADIEAGLWFRNMLAHPTMMLRRAAMPDGYPIGFRYLEDWRLWLSITRRGKLALIEQALVRYLLNPAGETARLVREDRIAHIARMLEDAARERGLPFGPEAARAWSGALLGRGSDPHLLAATAAAIRADLSPDAAHRFDTLAARLAARAVEARDAADEENAGS